MSSESLRAACRVMSDAEAYHCCKTACYGVRWKLREEFVTMYKEEVRLLAEEGKRLYQSKKRRKEKQIWLAYQRAKDMLKRLRGALRDQEALILLKEEYRTQGNLLR